MPYCPSFLPGNTQLLTEWVGWASCSPSFPEVAEAVREKLLFLMDVLAVFADGCNQRLRFLGRALVFQYTKNERGY